MKQFLKQVADHYYNRGNMSERCFVFPNRRSMVFFKKHLCEAVASDCFASPVKAPAMMTINDLFHSAVGVKPADKVRLLLALYESYAKVNPHHEPLDEFIFWGDVILGDFDDVDKYLVDPRQIFTNIKDYKEIQDSLSYLSQRQRTAVENLVGHFKEKADVPAGMDVKGRFLQIWNILYDLYKEYRSSLESKGMAYEGMVYRTLAERLGEEMSCDVFKSVSGNAQTFVFVGLNALNECEKTVLRRLKKDGVAEFCWDWVGDMIHDGQNKASFFMKENLAEFPQVEGWDEPVPARPEINVLSVASSTGQAKRLPDILARVAEQRHGGNISKIDADCAVVLPDEGLLAPVLNTIPEQIKDINVTMGLPMSGSLIYAMMKDAAAVQMHAVSRGGRWLFYHRQVWDLFSNAVFRKAADEQTMKKVAKIKSDAKYYIPQEDVSGTPLLDAIFRPVVADPKAKSKEQIVAFARYQKEVINAVAPSLKDDISLALELEYAKEYYKSVNILQEIGLEVLPMTYVRLLDQLLGTVSVHFTGEPLKGLQIMGPLETRALDFEDIVIMSANEGVFPRRSVSSSFIPPELRKGFQLPTYEYQDAMWAYYFYRMISRAKSVWMVVDTRTEGLKSGEESRFIKQLEYHFNVPLNRYVVKFGAMGLGDVQVVEKTDDDVKVIKDTVLSATAVQSYLACPAKFYYSVVKKLQSEDEVSESLDYGMFGTVFHEVMHSIYSDPSTRKPLAKITRKYIEGWLDRKQEITSMVKAQIMEQLNAVEVTGRNLVVADVIVLYVVKTLQMDLEQMVSKGLDSFDILGLELKVEGEFHGQRFKGFVDRVDSFASDKARVVDYKTGKVLKDDEEIDDTNAGDIAQKIFTPDVKDRPKIALQFFIYDMLMKDRREVAGRSLCNSVYSTAALFKNPPVTVDLNETFYAEMTESLAALLDEMYDTSVPFRRTCDETLCGYCDFKNICGR